MKTYDINVHFDASITMHGIIAESEEQAREIARQRAKEMNLFCAAMERQDAGEEVAEAHELTAEEFHDAGIAENFDDFVRGWLGYNSRQYRHGIIHFAPNICEATFDQGFDTLTAFASQLRIDGKTKILNFVKYGEQTMGDLLPNRF